MMSAWVVTSHRYENNIIMRTRVVRRQRNLPRGNQIQIETFSLSDSKFKVKVTRLKIMVWCEKSCHKEYTCEIWKPYLFWFESYGQGSSFSKVGQTSRSRSHRSKFMEWCERSCHKEYTCEIWKPCLSRFISYDQGKSFLKVGQTSKSRSLGLKFWYDVKDLVTRNTYVKYESTISCCS